jgi:hypothetical protein
MRPVAIAIVTLSLFATPAAAQSKRGQQLFAEARELLARGDIGPACDKFAESQRQDPRVGTLLNLGDCEERRGRLLEAAAQWKAAIELAQKTKDARGKLAKERADKLDKRIPRLTAKQAQSAPEGTTARLVHPDNNVQSLEPGSELRLDPGRYRVVVSAPGRATKSEDLLLVDGDSIELSIEPGPEPTGEPEGAMSQPDEPREEEWSPWRTAGIVLGAVGVASLGVGIGFGVVAISKNDESADHCDEANFCDDEGIALRESGLVAAHVSTGTIIGGAVLAGAGLTMFLLAPSVEGGEAAVRLEPWGASLRGTW